jgi:hypothetical protein
MRGSFWAVIALLLLDLASVQAGLFDRKGKPPSPPPANPSADAEPSPRAIERVLTIVNSLQTDKRSGKRADAAEALHDFDAMLFPEIVPALVQAALQDPDSSVRREAVQSLGRIRPTSREAAQALEQATKDDSYLVRLQARRSRLGYKVFEPPPPAPPEGGQVIRVPPAGPDGRLTPVPIPSVPNSAEAKEPQAPPPPVIDAQPPQRPMPVLLSKPQPKGKNAKQGEGPILVPPMR